MRVNYKQETFAESRKRKREAKSLKFPKVNVNAVVGWIDEALAEVRNEKGK